MRAAGGPPPSTVLRTGFESLRANGSDVTGERPDDDGHDPRQDPRCQARGARARPARDAAVRAPGARQGCPVPAEPLGRALIRSIGIKKEAFLSGYFKKGSGCSHCHGSGYFGRSGIFEIFDVDEDIQQLIYEHASLVDLRHKALACGMRTMRDDGLRKIEAGITTIEEVLSAVSISNT